MLATVAAMTLQVWETALEIYQNGLVDTGKLSSLSFRASKTTSHCISTYHQRDQFLCLSQKLRKILVWAHDGSAKASERSAWSFALVQLATRAISEIRSK